MTETTISAALFAFDDADESLERIPISARRALDVAGFRVGLDAWRAMPFDDRRRVTLAGVPEIVDPFIVEDAVRRAGGAVMRVRATPDPDAHAPPSDLRVALEPGRKLDDRAWTALRCVERYALVHALRHAPDRAYLHDVFDALMPHRQTTPAPSSAMRGASAAATSGTAFHHPPAPEPAFVRRSAPPPASIHPGVAPSSHPQGSPPSRGPALPSSLPPPPRLPSDVPPPDAVSTHLSAAGEVRMVDVGDKPETRRRAVAAASVRMLDVTIARIARREVDKGEVLATARVAGIQAAKLTSTLIPLCHIVQLSKVEVHLDVDVPACRIHVTAVAEAVDRTGVEMEAMVAVTAACLTIYDMLKGTDRAIEIERVRLLEKSGGRTGTWRREGT